MNAKANALLYYFLSCDHDDFFSVNDFELWVVSCNINHIVLLHIESRRNARKAFLALSGIKNDEDHDQIDSDKPSVDQTVMGSFEEVRASGSTPVSIIGAFCFIAWAYLLAWFFYWLQHY
jgi:hypothetical protein